MSLFGKIALRKGFLKEEQLHRALHLQEEIRALGLQKQLGEICCMLGLLERKQVDMLLRLQRLNEKAQQERRFGLTAVANGFVSAGELDEALEVLRKESFRRTLAQVLVQRGSLEPTLARALERATQRRAVAEGAEGDTRSQSDSDAGRLADTIEVEQTPTVDVEQRVADALFAAVALRDGHVLPPELARCVQDQLSQPEPPPLEEVFLERGILTRKLAREIRRAARDSRQQALRIPGYELLDVLGGSATSIVLRARHELMDREVAIKLVRADSEGEELLEEARTAGRLRHPNVVGIYEVGRVHRRIYFVMELVDGVTLLQAIQAQGRLDEARALRVTLDVARALQALEQAGLVHRDVKPGNIVLMGEEGPAKLTDLGLAREVDRPDADAPHAIYGTPHTMSPEQANGDPVDIRADLYGLGATLYHALVGAPPYTGEKPLEVLMAHITAPIPDPCQQRPELSPATGALVQRLLAKRPEQRPAGPDALVAELEALLG